MSPENDPFESNVYERLRRFVKRAFMDSDALNVTCLYITERQDLRLFRL